MRLHWGGVIMRGQWREVVRLAFKGPRFEDHALDLAALGELRQFQRMVAQTAKMLWHAANMERRRLPPRFEERTRLYLRRIEAGSAIAPLEVFVEQAEQMELFEEPAEIDEAIRLIHQVFRAIERDEPLPERFPRSLISEYERWGQGLLEDEAIEILGVGKEPARVTRTSRARLSSFADDSHEASVEIVGEVLEADIRHGRFQMWLDEKTSVSVGFSPEQEDEVTTALRDHRTVRLEVEGRGEFSAEGALERITVVNELKLRPVGEVPYDAKARPIEEVLTELAQEVPPEEWRKLPIDLTDHLDHYIYGTPRR